MHTVSLPRPTPYSTLPQSAFEVFVTSATDNVITLWDIRYVNPGCKLESLDPLTPHPRSPWVWVGDVSSAVV